MKSSLVLSLLLLLRITICYQFRKLSTLPSSLPSLSSSSMIFHMYTNDMENIPLAYHLSEQQDDNDYSIAASIGLILGQLHGSTLSDAVPSSDNYIRDNDNYYFTKIFDRLQDTSLFQQSNDVNKDDHYDNVRSFLNDNIGVNNIKTLNESIAMVRELLLTKSISMISTCCNNITINKSSSSLSSKVNINMDSCIYGPPGFDVGMAMATYTYYMPQNGVNMLKYTSFENNIRLLWSSYNSSFVKHSGLRYDNCDIILQETLRDSVGFLGWYLFLFVTTCNQVDINTNNIQLSISIEALRFFRKKRNFTSIDEVLKMCKMGLGKVYRLQ